MNRILLGFCLILSSYLMQAQSGFSHRSYDELLQEYVSKEGWVDYEGLLKHRYLLSSYLDMLSNHPPQPTWHPNEKLAFWINAYNAFTLDLVLDHYPIESIKDIGGAVQIPFVNTPWSIKFIRIGSDTYDLDNLEHSILRKEFDEPRIHFALVCAARSCPKLQNRAYVPHLLDQQLTKAAQDFLADPSKNEFVSEKKALMSKLFSWYKNDFEKGMDWISFINQYAPTQLNNDAKIGWKDYDWSLNEQ